MKQGIGCLILLAMCALAAGCASDSHDSELNGLWLQGHGYNNPNLSRMRNGQAPLNFDGSEARR
jgi:hypothetical protein